MLVLGLGLGMVMQVLVLAVQNAVDYADLGVATSGTTLFRSIGGSVGVSAFGAIFTAGLAAHLAGTLPRAQPADRDRTRRDPRLAAGAARDLCRCGHRRAASGVSDRGLHRGARASCWRGFSKDVPLRGPARADTIGESFAMPRDATSLEELEQIVSRLQRRENRWRVYQTIAETVGVALAPDEIWLLARLCRAGRPVTRNRRSAANGLPRSAAICVTKGMAVRGADGALAPSPRGRDAFERMVAERRARLAQILARWTPEEHEEVRAMLDRLAQTLMADPPAVPEGRAAAGLEEPARPGVRHDRVPPRQAASPARWR